MSCYKRNFQNRFEPYMEVFGLHIKTKLLSISVHGSKLSLIYKRSVGHRNDAWVGWEHMVCQWRGHDRLRWSGPPQRWR